VIDGVEVKEGLVELRKLVNDTHWIKNAYVLYEQGDGVYADGAVVKGSKVVGCLVGLARIVGAKMPTLVELPWGAEVPDIPPQSELARAMEERIQVTINNEFLGEEYMAYEAEDEDADEEEDGPTLYSIERWNDREVRTREHVLALLDRAIERQEASA
jgi:hypothetical protein